MMNIGEFKNEFIRHCRNELHLAGAADFDIEERSVTKAQMGELTGLYFRRPGLPAAPTIYVEDFYRMYADGLHIGRLSHEAVRTVMSSLDQAASFSEDDFDIRGHTECIRARLINSDANRELLKTAPHRSVADGLALVVYMVSGEFRALITNELLESFEMSEDELFEKALRVTGIAECPVIYGLTDALCSGPGERINLLELHPERMDAAADSMFVLSNKDLFWGASLLFCPGVIPRIRELLMDDFYVLPSSVHELIIVPAEGMDPVQLTDIIRSANRSVVSEHDMLSDDLYICESGNVRRVICGSLASGMTGISSALS